MSEYQTIQVQPNDNLSTYTGWHNYTVGTGTVGGYTCPNCHSWVSYGVYHTCSNWNPFWWQYPTYHPVYYPAYQSQPAVNKFCGSVEKMKDLPSAKYVPGQAQAEVGDAYFVENPGVLVVRVSNGWHTFDGE